MEDARMMFDLENGIEAVDEVFVYDKASQDKQSGARPWKEDPHHFKKVRISSIALLKMVTHARSGGTIEVMGVMQGKLDGDTFVIMDAYALPVEASETRVNAMGDANEYMVNYKELAEKVGHPEHLVGWYHSHPGYGCWLSGVDVNTQMTNQMFMEPWLAVVIDPTRTCTAGKVELGAFRSYPAGYTPPDASASEYQTIPLDKMEDFGVHSKKYYPLDVSYFKSSLDTRLLDLLWNKYWVSTLASSPLLANKEYTRKAIADLGEKLEAAEAQLAHAGRAKFMVPEKGKAESQLSKITKDATVVANEQMHGVVTQVVKEMLFGCAPAGEVVIPGDA